MTTWDGKILYNKNCTAECVALRGLCLYIKTYLHTNGHLLTESKNSCYFYCIWTNQQKLALLQSKLTQHRIEKIRELEQWYIDVKANLVLFYGRPTIQHGLPTSISQFYLSLVFLRLYRLKWIALVWQQRKRCVSMCVELGDGSTLTTLLLLNSLHAPCGAGRWGNFTPDRPFSGSANQHRAPWRGCHGNKVEATASVSPLSDCLTWSGACCVSSVDDLTPWAVEKYAIITGVRTGGVELQYFIICRLSHSGVTCKRIYVCAEEVIESGWYKAHTLILLPYI